MPAGADLNALASEYPMMLMADQHTAATETTIEPATAARNVFLLIALLVQHYAPWCVTAPDL